ncbi:MAG: sarcosine oxidase subunit gamma family protein [Gammaproteobacteria bacterium]|nr:sarcosine oxidase subunit gamma family protein [Gammaproteobacteria bacterium]MDH5302623.1 sarcosine oxidase subunit gamma family protein [Gammaproteobacteria bacterium]MDH5322136.1 sarcosine oxidase subunit gamma family protein [Gammaproteobacteria bacterium]
MSEALIVRVVADRGHINLRGNIDDVAFAAGVESACGVSLPPPLSRASNADLHIYWLGPDEWHLAAAAEKTPGLCGLLQQSTRAMHAAVNDLSGAFVTLAISGDRVRELLAAGCTIDLHPAAFADAACAATGLAKTGVLLARHDAEFHLIVRRSFANYLLQWLRRAGAEYGIEFA